MAIYINGKKVAGRGKLPTPEEIGALSTEGGTLTGDLNIEGAWNKLTFADGSGREVQVYQDCDSGGVAIGMHATGSNDGCIFYIDTENTELKDRLTFYEVKDGEWIKYRLYHECNKPTAADIGAEKEAFLVTFYSEDGLTCTADKTYAEVLAAIEAGQKVAGKTTWTTDSGYETYYSINTSVKTSEGSIVFNYAQGLDVTVLTMYADGTVTSLSGMLLGADHNGDSEAHADIREAIEAMTTGTGGVYVQSEAPADAPDNAIWIDTDEEGAAAEAGTQMELLWENASPDSEFAEQTITSISENLLAYSLLVIECRALSGTELGIVGMVRGGVDRRSHLQYVTNAGSSGAAYTRNCYVDANGKIYFSNCYMNSNEKVNTRMIPARIYGIKGVQA